MEASIFWKHKSKYTISCLKNPHELPILREDLPMHTKFRNFPLRYPISKTWPTFFLSVFIASFSLLVSIFLIPDNTSAEWTLGLSRVLASTPWEQGPRMSQKSSLTTLSLYSLAGHLYLTLGNSGLLQLAPRCGSLTALFVYLSPHPWAAPWSQVPFKPHLIFVSVV